MMKITAQQIASLIGGVIEGNPEVLISAPAGIESAQKGQITFLANSKYEQFLYSTNASVVIVDKQFKPRDDYTSTLIRVDDVYGAVAVLMDKFNVQEVNHFISEVAQVHESASLGKSITIGHYTVINQGVQVGEGSIVGGQVYLGENVQIGKNCIIHPGVKIYKDCVVGDSCIIHANAVIGSDGFGFAPDDTGTYKKIPQLGNVVLEQNVEIGSNTVIDRASMGSTIIKSGTKLDNLIQIAHNVEVGSNTVIAAQSGVSGSTKIGKKCIIGGQVGIVGHIHIADGTMIQAQSGVTKGSKPADKLYGSPAIEYGNYIRSFAYFKNLPKLAQEINMLKKEIEKLKDQPK